MDAPHPYASIIHSTARDFAQQNGLVDQDGDVIRAELQHDIEAPNYRKLFQCFDKLLNLGVFFEPAFHVILDTARQQFEETGEIEDDLYEIMEGVCEDEWQDIFDRGWDDE